MVNPERANLRPRAGLHHVTSTQHTADRPDLLTHCILPIVIRKNRAYNRLLVVTGQDREHLSWMVTVVMDNFWHLERNVGKNIRHRIKWMIKVDLLCDSNFWIRHYDYKQGTKTNMRHTLAIEVKGNRIDYFGCTWGGQYDLKRILPRWSRV